IRERIQKIRDLAGFETRNKGILDSEAKNVREVGADQGHSIQQLPHNQHLREPALFPAPADETLIDRKFSDTPGKGLIRQTAKRCAFFIAAKLELLATTAGTGFVLFIHRCPPDLS